MAEMSGLQGGSRRTRRRNGVRVLGLVAAAAAVRTGLGFVPAGSAAAPGRREMLFGLAGAAAAPVLSSASPAMAAAIPEYIGVTGRAGSYADKINGRWTIVFGKSLNDKAVYKKDGQGLYLMYNDCGQFQMADTVKGSCDGFGVNDKGTWKFDGTPDANVKVKPVKADEQVLAKPNIENIVAQEAYKIRNEAEVKTFMGNMESDQDQAAQRLMDKFGAKIAAGY